MRECGSLVEGRLCPECGKFVISTASFCRDRLCPMCQWRLALKRYAEMCAALGYVLDNQPLIKASFLTLTVKNCDPGDLRQTLANMAKAWNRVMARRKIKSLFSGWARSVEVTYNEKKNTFHPHYHVILLLTEEAAKTPEGVIRQSLSDAWYDACQTSYRPITDYKEIQPDEFAPDSEKLAAAIVETYKYTTKSKEAETMPLGAFRALVWGLNGVRIASFGGIIKDARAALKFADDDEPEADGAPIRCPKCNAEMANAALRWSFERKEYEQIVTQAKAG